MTQHPKSKADIHGAGNENKKGKTEGKLDKIVLLKPGRRLVREQKCIIREKCVVKRPSATFGTLWAKLYDCK